MAVTGLVFSLLLVGAFGQQALDAVNDFPGVFRVAKPAYLKRGFLTLTNWHQDPGYGAAWSNLWAVLALMGGARRPISGRWWLDAAVIGGLAFTVVMAFSRTGWLVLVVGLGVASWLLVRRAWIERRALFKRLGVAFLVALVLLSAVGAADVRDSGGDLDLQFAFRLSQGWDVLASLTGLFRTTDQFADVFSESEERADVWPEYWQMFREHPWLGVGLGVGWQTNSIGQEPHNLLLQLLAELGLVGLAAFGVLLAVILRKGSGLIGAAALTTALLPFMTQTVLFEPAWWFAAGLFVAAGNEDEVRITRGS
jgi:O-antigen ligase